MSVMEVKALEILVSRFQTLYFTKNLPENKKELYDALVVEVAGISLNLQRKRNFDKNNRKSK